MCLLEQYLDKHNNQKISDNIFKDSQKFGYDDEDIFKIHLDFMLENLYNITLTKLDKKRLNQTEFRNEVLKKFNNKCIISDNTCLDELTASHIIPISIEENYDIDNGLLLTETLHRTFDKYKWSINPNTLTVVISKNKNVGTIKKYKNKKLKIQMNEHIYNNLKQHYDTFLQINS